MRYLDQYLIQLLHRVEQAGSYKHLPDGSRPREEEERERMGLLELQDEGYLQAKVTDTFDGTIIHAELTPVGYRFLRQQNTQAAASDTQQTPYQVLSGRAKILFTWHLGNDWSALADLLEISPYEQRRFSQGDEGRAIWEWLELRNRLGELPGALEEIERDDLAGEILAAKPSTRPMAASVAPVPDEHDLYLMELLQKVYQAYPNPYFYSAEEHPNIESARQEEEAIEELADRRWVRTGDIIENTECSNGTRYLAIIVNITPAGRRVLR